jgi:hypothetical protein
MLFAQIECALKVLGFHYGEGDAKPNWDKFVKELEEVFDLQNPDVLEAIRYLEEKPPKKQMVVDSELKWVSVNQEGNRLKEIFLSIRRIRNNLFHGGKFKGIYFEHPERSTELIKSAIIILEYTKKIYPDINPN